MNRSMPFGCLPLILAMLVCIFAACGSVPEQYDDVESGLICYKETDFGELSLEVLYPTRRVSRKNPTVMLIYGGGWISGSREDFLREFEPLCSALRAQGVTLACVDYRPAVDSLSCRDCLDDCIDALDYLIDNAGKYDIDKNRIGVMGYSAGAQLALMTAIEMEDAVKFCVSLSGPTVLPASDKSMFYSKSLAYYSSHAFLGYDINDITSMSPVTQLNRRCKTDFLLVNGDMDDVVVPAHASTFCNEAKSLRIAAELMIIPGLTHSYASFDGLEGLCEDVAGRVIAGLQK